ncbi:hypothetical protein ACFE04_017237 [Oxalis oulophora]
MKLYVDVLQAKDLPVSNGYYVKVKVGNSEGKTKTLTATTSTTTTTAASVWNEEFVFRVHDDDYVDEDIVVSIGHGFNGSDDLLGRVIIPVLSVANEDNQSLPPTWFQLLNNKFVNKDSYCGKILLAVSLHKGGQGTLTSGQISSPSDTSINGSKEFQTYNGKFSPDTQGKIPERKQFFKSITNRLDNIFHKNNEASRTESSSELSSPKSDNESSIDEEPPCCSFEEAMEIMQSKNDNNEVPDDLQGGILIDQSYLVSSDDLNRFLFAPGAQFRKDLAELQGTTDLEEGPWVWKSDEMTCLTRFVTYTKAASKLVKAVKATEEQTYINASEKCYAVFVSVDMPDVPYGSTFKVELLYKMIPGCELSSGEETSRLTLSWAITFVQHTMMKGMIEAGTSQGLKESFSQFADLLAQKLKVHNSDKSEKELTLASLKTEHQSDWQLASEYFRNFTVMSTLLMIFYFLVHILLCKPHEAQGLEFGGLDLPDSFGEFLTCGILFIHLESVYNMISHFVQARLRRGSDHGVKAQGNGWVLTVALIEAINLASLESTTSPDPYVVFTCNGKTKTSSVELQAHDPHWNEIFEFDAMEEPPSVLDVEVFDFDGPFNQGISLGHAEINFLKHTSAELADLSVNLEGKLAQSSQSKLHLRIFLDNNNGVESIKESLTKMEKEVGKKLTLRSPHRSATFQKLFSLPPEEYLINDFTCHLRRKLLLQGRLFLSARIVGFYANLFGHKTKFYFMWEDIEEIKTLSPSLSSMGSPTLVMVLQKGRGLDATHGARKIDEHGRLKFYFQSFVSFNVASRTIIALWRTRTLTPEEKEEIAEEHQDQEERSNNLVEDGWSFFDMNNENKSKIYTAEIPTNIESLMQLFDGGEMEHRIMAKSGCHDYTTSPWEPINLDVFERRVSYRFSRRVLIFGGEVVCVQQKLPNKNSMGWIVNETMSLSNVPFGDHFRIRFKYKMETSEVAHNVCKCEVCIWITWLKSNMFQHRISRNITDKFTNRMVEVFELVKRELLLCDPPT